MDYENRHYGTDDFYDRDDSVEWEIGEYEVYVPGSIDEEIPF